MKCVILGSGKGSNAKSILEAWSNKQLGIAQIEAVLSDNKMAPILEIADSYSVTSRFIEMNSKSALISSEESKILCDAIEEFTPDLLILAGFMKILPAEFIL